jgi:hypothetical protein
MKNEQDAPIVHLQRRTINGRVLIDLGRADVTQKMISERQE